VCVLITQVILFIVENLEEADREIGKESSMTQTIKITQR
jgi:hypothetical protein